MSIFISIAAYRDPELLPTLRDCVEKARYPAELRFGICWQHAEGEAPPPDDPRLRVLDVEGGWCAIVAGADFPSVNVRVEMK